MAQATVQTDRRAVKAAGIVERGEIEPVEGRTGVYRVWDTTGSGEVYIADATRCQCPDFGRRGIPCKHSQAAGIMDAELQAYAQFWDERARMAAEQPRCPACGAALDVRQYYIGGRAYTYLRICPSDASHYGGRA